MLDNSIQTIHNTFFIIFKQMSADTRLYKLVLQSWTVCFKKS